MRKKNEPWGQLTFAIWPLHYWEKLIQNPKTQVYPKYVEKIMAHYEREQYLSKAHTAPEAEASLI